MILAHINLCQEALTLQKPARLQENFSIDSLAISCPDCPQGVTFNATEDGTLRALSPENLQCFKTFTVPLGENKSVLASRSEVRISSSTRNVQNPDVCCRRCLGISWAQTAISTQIAKKALAGSQVKWPDAPLRLRRLSDSRQTSFAYHHFDCGFRLLVNLCSQQTGECTLGSLIVRGSAPKLKIFQSHRRITSEHFRNTELVSLKDVFRTCSFCNSLATDRLTDMFAPTIHLERLQIQYMFIIIMQKGLL